MSTLKERLEQDVKTSMKARDAQRLSCLRMIKSKLLEREVALRTEHGRDYSIDDDEAQKMIAAYAKQRRDSIESYQKGGREDLVAAEQAELQIVSEYLPAQLGDDELKAIVKAAVEESGASSAKDMGNVMKVAMPKVAGRADGKRVNRFVRELLGA